MRWFKTLPVAYQGQLEDVRIVNFSADAEELRPLVPKEIPILIDKGRGFISLADLEIRKMRPRGLPSRLSLNYRHIALRVLIDDSVFDSEPGYGLYFLKSYCAQPCLICGGRLFTDYRLCMARIKGKDDFHLSSGKFFLRYQLGKELSKRQGEQLKYTAALNKAYALHGESLWRTHITPDTWPLQAVNCKGFDTNLFRTARLERAYKVKGSLEFERSKLVKLNSGQRREHLQPGWVKYSPL